MSGQFQAVLSEMSQAREKGKAVYRQPVRIEYDCRFLCIKTIYKPLSETEFTINYSDFQ